ncbi:hypothetical protein [Serratia marcescens]|uniref:hypothetical protein n=1 Tax=Serratia marcescens TaxID=615 RepID=UPI000AB0E9B4|nr:hypothetical protein [Serratia marcescens]
MTTIQRFTPDYKMHAVRFEAFAREAEHGEYVRFDAHQQEVIALKAERDALADRVNALAVENAGFKHALSVILEHVDVTDKGQAGVVAMIANDELFNSETPATDAALAAIQARAKVEAIELLIGRKKRELADMHPDTHAFGMTSALIRNQIRCLESFATELREGK